MADRVHPYVVEEGEAVIHPSSLKPRSTATTATDEGREQEQSLIGSEAAGGRRRRRCLRCCCWVGAAGVICLVLVGILVLLFFLVLHPKLPNYTITTANMTSFRIGGGSTAALWLSADLEFTVRMRNDNKKIGLDYRSITATLFYDDMTIGEGAIPAFYQGHRNTTLVRLALVGHHVPLTPSLGASLQARLGDESSLLSLRTRAIVRLRLRIGRWTSHTSKVRLNCHLQITNPLRANVQLLHNSCTFKLLRLRL